MQKIEKHAKKMVSSGLLTALLLFTVGSGTVYAETSAERTIRNTQDVLEVLHGVNPEALDKTIQKVSERRIRRLTPEQPIWIVEIIEGKILFYEGQPQLTGKEAASALLDDTGYNFGMKALEFGKSSRGGWLKLQFGKQEHSVYCSARFPFVVCSFQVG